MQTPGGLAIAPLKLARLVRGFGANVIHGWMYHANVMATIASLLVPGVPVACSIHSGALDTQTDKWTTIGLAKIDALLSRLSARVLSCSEAGARFHVKFGYPAGRIEVIQNGFDLEAFKPNPSARGSLRDELGLHPETLLVGMVGRFATVKNHRGFLQSARLLLDRASNQEAPHFVLCGPGVDHGNATLVAWISEFNLDSHLHILGPRNDLPRVFGGLDIVTSCSIWEAFPLVVGEAMACGVPCVVSNVGDSALLVGDTGRVVPAGNPSYMADTWRQLLLLEPEKRRALGERARNRIKERFSLSIMVRRYEALYQELARKRTARREALLQA
jgi:glycosyltransferase involved in cell wall biosynthesis